MFKVKVFNPAGGIEVLENRRSAVKAVESAISQAVEYGFDTDTPFTVEVAPSKAQVRLLTAE